MRDLDTLFHMLKGALAHRRVGMTQTAQLVSGILKQIGVDGTNLNT